MPPRAHIEYKSCWLGKEFGEAYARKIFGDVVVDALPRYGERSKYAGKFKVELEWQKCTRGGWVSAGVAGYGHVENRVNSMLTARIIEKPFRGPVKIHAVHPDPRGYAIWPEDV